MPPPFTTRRAAWSLLKPQPAVEAARKALPAWAETPVVERARILFRYKALLEEQFESLARLVTREHGKTLDEARG